MGYFIGYLAARRVDEKASYKRRLGAAGDSLSAAVMWAGRIDRAAAEGFTARQTLRRWIGVREDPVGGGIPSGVREQEAPSYEALSEFINPGYTDPGVESPPEHGSDWGGLSPFNVGLIYRPSTNGEIRYLPVIRDGVVLGYLWAAENDDAAYYIERKDAGTAGVNGGAPWISRLRQAKADGLAPLQAVRQWVGAPEDPIGGTIPTDVVEARAGGSDDLRRLAGW
jgi:hypothetical protein